MGGPARCAAGFDVGGIFIFGFGCASVGAGSSIATFLSKVAKRQDGYPTAIPLKVQVPNNRILTQNLHYNYYYPNPKYLIIGHMDPLGWTVWRAARRVAKLLGLVSSPP